MLHGVLMCSEYCFTTEIHSFTFYSLSPSSCKMIPELWSRDMTQMSHLDLSAQLSLVLVENFAKFFNYLCGYSPLYLRFQRDDGFLIILT